MQYLPCICCRGWQCKKTLSSWKWYYIVIYRSDIATINSPNCSIFLIFTLSFNHKQDQTSKEVNCAYIESIRYGTFDGKGQVYMSSSQSGGGSFQEGVTPGQTASLVIFSLICAGLAIYSCVLHHEITNLLLKSFSMGLLNANTVKMRSKKSSRRKKGKGVIDSDAETQGEMA